MEEEKRGWREGREGKKRGELVLLYGCFECRKDRVI